MAMKFVFKDGGLQLGGCLALAFLLCGHRSSFAAPGLPYSAPGIDVINVVDPGVPGFVGPDGDGLVTVNNSVNPLFQAWATEIVNYSPAPNLSEEFKTPTKALGPVTADFLDIVSLGELSSANITASIPAGSITLGFGVIITNDAGPDFAVFENGFVQGGTGKIMGDLAYVEVSSDGVTFARFPGDSRTPATVGPFGVIEAEGIFNLAGKHVNNADSDGLSVGTPFNLDDLAGDALVTGGQVNLNHILYIRLIDIPGDGSFHDAQGDPIYDAWPSMASGGFDLEAVGVIHAIPPSASSLTWALYP
ncbi:hypothetical protein IT570_14720 [Candidatus Sumerlaeota bacterium]|nr:hypothetical protein [Candidatus Sumerlaeota bacterium]